MTDTNLEGAVIRGAQFENSILEGANLKDVFVKGSDWLEQIMKWNVLGAKEISSRYELVPEKSFDANFVLKELSFDE